MRLCHRRRRGARGQAGRSGRRRRARCSRRQASAAGSGRRRRCRARTCAPCDGSSIRGRRGTGHRRVQRKWSAVRDAPEGADHSSLCSSLSLPGSDALGAAACVRDVASSERQRRVRRADAVACVDDVAAGAAACDDDVASGDRHRRVGLADAAAGDVASGERDRPRRVRFADADACDDDVGVHRRRSIAPQRPQPSVRRGG